MTTEQQYKVEWLSRAKQAEQTIFTLHTLQTRNTQLIQELETLEEDCTDLKQQVQKNQLEIKKQLVQLEKVREEVKQAILSLPDITIRNIFLRKYLAYENNNQIAEAMFYDFRTIQRKHQKGLNMLTLPDMQKD